MQELQLGRAWRELEEAEGGAEGGEVTGDHAVTCALTFYFSRSNSAGPLT
jgi:hypothetical protein